MPFPSVLVLQIGTMKCFYCPQKDASLVPWDLLSPDDQIFLRDKYPDAGQGAVCNLCVRSVRPSAFFSRRSSSTSSSAPQSMDSGLQMPSASRVVSGLATSLWLRQTLQQTPKAPQPQIPLTLWPTSLESGVVEPSASVAQSSSAAIKTSDWDLNHRPKICRPGHIPPPYTAT